MVESMWTKLREDPEGRRPVHWKTMSCRFGAGGDRGEAFARYERVLRRLRRRMSALVMAHDRSFLLLHHARSRLMRAWAEHDPWRLRQASVLELPETVVVDA